MEKTAHNKPDIDELKEKSHLMATSIILVTQILQAHDFDLEYAKEIANDLASQANRHESMMVLNPSPSFIKPELLREQAKTLMALCSFIEGQRKCIELKNKLSKENQNKDQISKLFW